MDNDLLTIEEIIQTVKMLKMIHKLSLAYNEGVDLDLRIRYMTEVVNSRESFINEQKRLWLERNKSGGLENSINYLAPKGTGIKEDFCKFVDCIENSLLLW